MSDLEVRRLTRELLRTGLDAEQVLDVVLAELSRTRTARLIVDHRKETVVDFADQFSATAYSGGRSIPPGLPMRQRIRWSVEAVVIAPLAAPHRPPEESRGAPNPGGGIEGQGTMARPEGFCPDCVDGKVCDGCLTRAGMA